MALSFSNNLYSKPSKVEAPLVTVSCRRAADQTPPTLQLPLRRRRSAASASGRSAAAGAMSRRAGRVDGLWR